MAEENGRLDGTMDINIVIREKRKALDLTQEQVAEYLGVSTPAVNKWEKGVTYPDISLLPALARLLKTDLNTLLCFQENLTQQEISSFLNELVTIKKEQGFEKCFDAAMEKIKEFPESMQLIQKITALLQGIVMLEAMTPKKKEKYDTQITALYERVALGEDQKEAESANYMLASRYIQQEQYDKAKETLDRLPEYNALDKRNLKAQLLMKEGKMDEAAKIYEHKLLSNIQDNQIALVQLVKIAVKEGDAEYANHLQDCGKAEIELFGMWKYGALVVPLEKALEEQNEKATLELVKKLLQEVLIPWDYRNSIVFRHTDTTKMEENKENLGFMMLPALLSEFEEGTKYEFLRSNRKFQQLITDYRTILQEKQTSKEK